MVSPSPRLTGFNSDCQYFLIVWKLSHFSRFTSLPHFHPWELEGLEILVRNETAASTLTVAGQPAIKGCSLFLPVQTFSDQSAESDKNGRLILCLYHLKDVMPWLSDHQ